MKKRKLSNGKEDKSDFQYGTNLTVYDKLNRCLLPDGDYQLLMHELTQNSPKITHVNTSWETIPDLEVSYSIYELSVGLFAVEWLLICFCSILGKRNVSGVPELRGRTKFKTSFALDQ